MVAELGEVVWIVDFNRQSLDRVVPNIGAPRLQGMFAAAGWQVLTVKYGRLLNEHVRPARRRRAARPHRRDVEPGVPAAAALHARRAAGPAARRRVRRPRQLGDAARRPRRRRAARRVSATSAGTTSPPWATPSRPIDDTRPTVIFAYTIKGYGLPSEGHPQNHSVAAEPATSCGDLAARLGADPDDPWRRFASGSPEAGAVRARPRPAAPRAAARSRARRRSRPTSAARRTAQPPPRPALGRPCST